MSAGYHASVRPTEVDSQLQSGSNVLLLVLNPQGNSVQQTDINLQ